MAADSTLVEGAYRASRYIDLGERAARKELGENLSKIGQPTSQPSTASTTPQRKKQTKPSSVNNPEVNIKDTKIDNPNDVETDGLTEEQIAEQKRKAAEKKRKEEEAKAAALQKQALQKKEEERLYQAMLDKKDQFLEAVNNSDNYDADAIKGSVVELEDEVAKMEEVLLDLNENFLAKGEHTSFGYGNVYENAPQAEKDWIMNIIKGGEEGDMLNRIELAEDGKYYIPGPVKEDGTQDEYTVEELAEHLQQYEIDNATFNKISDLATKYRKEGKDGVKPGSFNRQPVYDYIKGLVEKGNLRSIVLDKSYGNTSYAQDLLNSDDLANIKYEDLNLEPPKGDEDGRINSSDNIDDELKQRIVDILLKDDQYKDSLIESVSNYFTGHIERNHYAENMRSKIQRPYEGAPGMIETEHLPTRVGHTFEKQKIG